MIQRPSGLVVPDAVDATARPTIALASLVDASCTREAPAEWERRLREISPIRSDLAHLRFRWREPHPSWLWPKAGVWLLYSWTPRHLVSADRAAQFRRHWSELPTAQQPGRRAYVSDYQFWVWHEHGYEARPFWILHGHGGTPAKYTDRERRYLDASDLPSDPIPIGTMPPCPFDERAVRLVLARDRLIQAGNRLDMLAALDRPDALRAEDEAAEHTFRETFLDTWKVLMEPSVDFMKWYLTKSDADQTLPRTSREQANAAAQWRDHFLEHGNVIGARPARSRAVPVALSP